MKYLGDRSVSSWLVSALKIAWIFGLVATISMFLAVVGLAIAGDRVIPDQLASDLTITAGGLRIRIDTQFVEPLHRNLFLSFLLAGTAMGGIVLAIIHNLQHLVSSFVVSNPFNPQNVKRLKCIGWILLAWAFIEASSGLAVGTMFSQMNRLPGLHVTVHWRPNLSTILMAALSFVLAEVFRLGTKLRKDNELTI